MIELVRTRWERGLRLAARDEPVLWVFAATIFLSALLLFSVQPIFAKMVLPKLGGTPAVWAVSMCFFQAALLAGYCYAHALNRWAGPRLGPILHVSLLAFACVALPFGLPAGAEPPAGDAYLWLIQVLAIGVGLPFFAVSANAPLLQAWFARSGHPHAGDPYFLYGASNLGSLLALLAYPIAIEPALGLAAQANVWTICFVLLALAIAASALAMKLAAEARGLSLGLDADAEVRSARAMVPLTVRDRLIWVALAFVPSGLLVAYTTHLSTDIASAPFLWVLPLAAFLATFIVVFRETPLIPERLLEQCLAPLAAIALVGLATPALAQQVAFVAGSAFAVVAVMLVAHRALYLRRPDPARLTEFYIWMSLGGVLGGVFAAIIAPQIFATVIEYPLLLVLGVACQRGLVERWTVADWRRAWPVAAAALGSIVALTIIGSVWSSIADQIRIVTLLVFLVLIVVWRQDPIRPFLLCAAALVAMAVIPRMLPSISTERSFFGVHRVAMSADGKARIMMHGTTIHGAERLTTDAGVATARPVPATYYYPGSPMAEGFDLVRATRSATAANGPGVRTGIVGLGAGSLACYARPGDDLRYFEIDPVVAKIASNPRYFRFLSQCQPKPDIVIGDARLTLAKEPSGSFDYLVVDAFSSDAVPVHLLTVEALSMYLSKLAAGGLIAIHVSNKFMDLDTVTAATARALPNVSVRIVKRGGRPEHDGGIDSAESWVVFITRSAAIADRIAQWPDSVTPADTGVAGWTDDYSNVVSSIIRARRGRG